MARYAGRSGDRGCRGTDYDACPASVLTADQRYITVFLSLAANVKAVKIFVFGSRIAFDVDRCLLTSTVNMKIIDPSSATSFTPSSRAVFVTTDILEGFALTN